jgi:hypothetical protein
MRALMLANLNFEDDAVCGLILITAAMRLHVSGYCL